MYFWHILPQPLLLSRAQLRPTVRVSLISTRHVLDAWRLASNREMTLILNLAGGGRRKSDSVREYFSSVAIAASPLGFLPFHPYPDSGFKTQPAEDRERRSGGPPRSLDERPFLSFVAKSNGRVFRGQRPPAARGQAAGGALS